MFFQSKSFKLLLPLLAYLLFAFQWVYNYMAVWYANVPDETQYFKKPQMGYYMMYAYLLLPSFVLFMIFGIIYLLKNPVPKYVTYVLTAVLLFSSYFVWHYSATFKSVHISVMVMFGNLVLFAFSIFKLNGKAT
jgi:hypothetical protein